MFSKRSIPVMVLKSGCSMGKVHDPFTGVHFKLIDETKGENGKTIETVVHCLVSTEALQDRAAKDGLDQSDIEGIFDTYLSQIEDIAMGQHRAGKVKPMVTSAELCPA
jgi:hypothetical protein